MPRTSPVHYIAPSAISVVPNANNSENDLAINVVRGAKMKLFSPKIPELDFVNNTFQEWTFAGRNRRLASSSAEYTVYGRLSKTDKKDGYLVFAPKVGGKDKYPYVTMDGLATDTAGYSTGNYWYVKLGDVSLPDASHKRTVTFDTGILGTDQFNTEWNLDPDDMPLRVLISCKIDGKDAGPTPYVPWDKTLDLQASLIEGWESETTTQADHWTIEPNTGATNWPDASRAASFAHSGHIILYHARENSSGTDDFAGQVSIPLTVTAWGKDDEGNDEVIGTAGITIFAETNEKYELVLSSSVMSYSPADGTYSPSEGIKVRIRAVDQKGDVFLLTKTQIDAIGLKASYAQSGTDSWTNLAFTGSGEAAAEATIETTAFTAQQNISVRLQNAADAELHSATVAFVKDGEDSKEREWIFLRSTEAITFTDDPQGEHPKPSVIEYGEVEPGDRAAGHVDNDKNQDGWVPEGWWDEMQGTDEDNRYEYGAYRDYVHDSEEQEGERRGHWGEFTNPVIWSYHAMDGMTYRCRWTLNGTEVWQLAAYTNGAFLGELPLTATLMRRKGSNNEEEVTGEADITVSFEGLSQVYTLHAQNPTFTISETENPEMIAHLNDANLMSITVNFTVGDETFSYNIPMLRRTEGESWWKYDPITDTVEFLKTISRAVIHNLNITGTFDAIKGYIDDLRSHNYSSGLLDGSGFRLTNDNGDGSSELEVDLLKVRKKATFMELEIREETFVGGNNHYSPAGSIIYRVEYMDENDEQLGYTVMKVPFLLKRFAFLGRVFNYAARKRVRRAMTDDEWKHVHHFRCYLLADDGTTATRNWWKVGDQPRCQTFNKAISSQNKRQNTYNWKKDHFNDDPSTPMPDFTTIEGPFETAYYWRLVSNVGSEKLDDGHVYDFIDMPYEGWNYTDSQGRQHSYTDNEKRSFRDGGSGIPVAGDTIVCIGNRTDEERMNVISLYTSGNDNNPPAIKGYRGIHSFSFENCLVWEMSPEQFLVRSKAFKLLDDSGYQFPVPLERGEWQPGVRYHWYDRVSWIGNIWLCQVLDTYVWQNATGTEYQAWQVEDVQYGEGNFQYSVQGAAGMEADEILTGTDHYYRTGKVNGQTVYYIKLYTYSEPSKNNDLWLREVHHGRNGMDGDGVEYVFIRTANDTAPYITTSSDTYDGKTYLDDDYLPMSSAGRTTDDPTGPTKALPFEWVMQRTMGDPDAETGERQWHKYGEGQTDGKMSLWATFSESTIRLDLSNEMDMVQTDDKGLVTAERVVTTVVRLFDGTTEITLDPSKLTTAGGMTPYPKEQEGKGIKLTFRVTKNFTLASAMEITISYPYKNETYTAEMTIAPSLGQPIFQLSPSHSSLPCTRKADNTLNNPPALSLKIVKISGASSEEKDATSANLTAYGLTVRYSTTSMPSSASAGTAWPNGNSVQAATTDQNVHIAMFNSAGTLLDRETVPIIKDGENGQTAVRLDLDNENDSMLYDGRGTLVSGNVTATAYMFDGPTDVSGSTTFTISAREGVTAQQATISGRTVTVTGMTDAKAKVTVQGVYTDGQNKTHTKTSVLTLKKIVDGDKYDLVISPNAIPYNVTTDTPATSTISIQVFRTHIENGAAKRELSAPPSGYGVYAGSTALTASSTGTYSTTTDNSAIDSLTVKIAKSATSTDVLDIETIPIAKAKNGQGSFTSHVFKRQNTQPAAPTGGSYSSPVPSGWSDGVPDGTAIVWMSTRIFSSDGQAPQQDAWTTPRQMTDTADFDVEFSSYASPSAPTGHPNTNPQWGNTSDSTTIWMATSECHNGVWSDWQVAKIKGEKGADSTVPGPQGDQGKYEIKQFAISAYKKTDSEGTMPRDCSESSWQNTAPVTTSSKPYVWQRTKTYDPSTGVSTSWSYVRLTGEEGDDGSPGKTGLWYRFLGVYGVDCGPGTDTPVKNTETVGYYVKQDGYNNFYLNTLPADETNTNSLGGKGWESMNATFQYFITEALFGSYAHLGHFIINGQWMISQEGKYNGSYSDDYEDFTPGNFGKKNKFIPNFAVDGLSGKVYANDFMVNGVIRESGSYVSGTFVRINAGTDSESSEETRVTILDTKGLYSRGSQDGFRLIHSASGVQLQRWSPHGGAAGDWVPFYAGRAVRKITTTTELDMYDDYIIAGDGEFDVYLPESPSAGKVITVKNMQDGINIKTKGSDRIVLNNNAKNLTSKDLDSYDRAELVYYNHEWFWSYMET